MFNFRTLFTLCFSMVSVLLIAQDIDFSQFEQIKARNIGPAGMSGRVTAIDVDLSNTDRIFVGTASGGVWLSENRGISWKPIFDDNPTLSIGAIKINQANPSEIWVGTGEGNPRNSQNSGAGVYKSIDGGKTWQFKGLKNTRVIHRILIDHTKEGTVYVGAQGAAWGDSPDRGLFKTTDGGDNWDKILYVNEKTGIGELVMDPNNPNKIIAAMWEFGRKPWTFNSGGPGGGLYITHDAGKNWKKITDKEGLPKGDLGRIGIAIAASNPNTIYALVEAKENALYKSFDGGDKWVKHSTDENIGNRPFYYFEIYVDPKNENRLYSIHTYITMSEDGGKTYTSIADYGNAVHPDHHAFWINPNDPSFLIDGNDGGLAISEDMGKTWRFINNLPVGQFYHVNVDNDFPYNVYGGMQDNGSWVGPGFALKSGGITNYDWQEVFFGDGFDVAPKPGNNRYVYAMSQGGNLGLVDKETGMSRFIKPNLDDTTKLRYNWNAALAIDPFNECGLYYCSQFVHYSSDCGASWKLISPDLTTNDTSKQHQDVSGGLTIDATNAENNTTIISVAPSPVDSKVIWVGTDDGNLQITRDGGSSWVNVIGNIKEAPKTAWIPQIEVSSRNAGEAFVVINNYRLNDWSAYLFHTSDYGMTWKRLVDDSSVNSFVTAVTQDKKEPNLLFLGTDAGLYISFNMGAKWHKWDKGFPSVQIRDMKIQEEFDDLVLGTFGRAFWVIDDIGPFREMAKGDYTSKDLDLVSISQPYLSQGRSYQGIRFIAQGEFQGDNKNTNATLSIWIKPEAKKAEKKNDVKKNDVKKPEEKKMDKKQDSKKSEEKKTEVKEEAKKPEEKGTEASSPELKKKESDKIRITVLDVKGDTIRNFSRKIDKKGLVRLNWNLESNGVRGPSRREEAEDADPPYGTAVLPGKYYIYADFNGAKDSMMTEVKMDPRIELTVQDLADNKKALKDYESLFQSATDLYDKVKKAKKSLGLIEKLTESLTDSTKTNIEKLNKEHKKKLEEMDDLFFNKEGLKGIQRDPENLQAYLFGGRRYIGASAGKPGPNAMIAVKQAKERFAQVEKQVADYLNGDWQKFKERILEVQFNLFKE